MLLSTVAEALADAGIECERTGHDVDVTDVVHHADDAREGVLFCCVRGSRFDGHRVAGPVVDAGAAALVVDAPVDVVADVPRLVVTDVRRAMGPAAAAVHGHPSRDLVVLGVTGTNGKTTTVAMLDAVLTAGGRDVRVVGTLTSRPGEPPTTPEAPELQRLLGRWRDEGVDAVAMEVSSHAMVMGRVDGTRFAVVGFTTLGEDHLDLHGSIEEYFEAKASLFTADRADRAVVRRDDPWGARLLERLAGSALPVTSYGLDGTTIETTSQGERFDWHGHTVDLPLAGAHNVANALCAATMAAAVGVDDDRVAAGLGRLAPVAGRFQLVDRGQSFTVAVDYAHTPDALRAVLGAARERADGAGGRVVVVFGCGGDRDRTKRPAMGAVAATLADVIIVTSDNPRSEDPELILDDVLTGVPASDRDRVVRDVDRAAAIHHATRVAQDHDVVVVAGKGHETTQTFADRVEPFDDVAVVGSALDEVLGS